MTPPRARNAMPRRLYFFPALLPLVEIVPWLLTLLAAVAGAAGLTAFLRRHRRAVMGASAALLLAAGGVWLYYGPPLAIRLHATATVDTADIPATQTFPGSAMVPPDPARAFGLLWTRRVDSQILATPVVSGNTLVYGQYKGGIAAVSAGDGAPAWFLPTAEPVFSLTLDEDGTLYAGEGLHYTRVAALFAMTPEDGTVLWQRNFGGHIEETVTISPGGTTLYLGTGPGGLWALNTQNAAIRWRSTLGHIDAAPLLHGDTLYVPAQKKEGAPASEFHAIDARDGTPLWHVPLPGQPWGSPLIDRSGNLILTTTGRGQIGVRRDTDTGWAQGITTGGTLQWQTALPGMPLQPGIYLPGHDTVIHSLKTGDIIALEASSGKIRWQVSAGGELQAPAALVADGRLLAATTYDGKLTVYDAVTGTRKARWNVGKYTTASPVSAGDILYVPTAWSLSAFNGLNALAAHARRGAAQ